LQVGPNAQFALVCVLYFVVSFGLGLTNYVLASGFDLGPGSAGAQSTFVGIASAMSKVRAPRAHHPRGGGGRGMFARASSSEGRGLRARRVHAEAARSSAQQREPPLSRRCGSNGGCRVLP
jgi:hypothetical protein